MTGWIRVRRIALLGVLVLVAGATTAQTMRVMQPAARPASPANAAVLDYQGMYNSEVQKNRALRAELDAANKRISDMIRPGGSQVMAYCATPVESRNTAGASSDCSRAGYGCEAVSGLCRTTCQTSDMCAPGFLCDTGVQHCVPQPTGG